MNVLQICAVICSFISLLLLLISLGSDFWVVNGPTHAGLWNLCVNSACAAFGINVTAADHATRAFMLLGMITGAVSFFGLCASLFVLQLGSLFLTRISATASFLAAICAMIAMAVFTGTSANLIIIYGWSFCLGWASFPLFLFTGVLAQLIKNDTPPCSQSKSGEPF